MRTRQVVLRKHIPRVSTPLTTVGEAHGHPEARVLALDLSGQGPGTKTLCQRLPEASFLGPIPDGGLLQGRPLLLPVPHTG